MAKRNLVLILNKVTLWAMAAFYLLYKGSLLMHLPPASKFDDSASYLRTALNPIFSLQFWASSRPPFVPLVYKLAGYDLYRISVVQVVMSAICWLVLAVMVARSLKTGLVKILAFGMVLLFSLSADITRWDTSVMSESVSISLFVLWLANWLWLREGWHWGKSAALVIVAAGFILSRETNAWVVLMLAVILLAMGLIWKSQRKGLVLSVIFFLLFIGNSICSDIGQRWVMPFLNVLGTRILPTPEYLSYFETQGMPVNDTLMQYENHWSTRLRKEIKVNPELQDFHSWLVDKGKGAYMRFLVTHPEPLLQDPLRNFVTMMSANVEMYTPAGFKPALGKPLGEVVFPKIWVWLLAWAAPLLIGLLVPSLVRGRDHNLLIPFVMLTLVFPQAVISYNGDSMGLTRHPLLAAIELRLAVWLVITYYADKLMTLILEKWVSIHLFFSIGRNRMYLVSVLGICLVMASVILEYVHGDGARVIGWRQWTVGVTGLILVAYGIALGVKNRKRG